MCVVTCRDRSDSRPGSRLRSCPNCCGRSRGRRMSMPRHRHGSRAGRERDIGVPPRHLSSAEIVRLPGAHETRRAKRDAGRSGDKRMVKLIRVVALAAISLSALGAASSVYAQGIYLGPGGVGVDTGVRIGGGYREREYRRHREDRRDRYERRRDRDRNFYDGGNSRRRQQRYEQND